MNEDALLGLIEQILTKPAVASWHSTNRQTLGVPDDCSEETILSISFGATAETAKPLAFVLTPEQNTNILAALSEFMRMTFHPLSPDRTAIALIDYMPPLASASTKAGYSHRWVMDANTYAHTLPLVKSFIDKVM